MRNEKELLQDEENGSVYTNAEGYLRDKWKFQRTRREYSYLPYYENISQNASCWLEQIKAGLAISTLPYAADSGIFFWMNQLSQYLNRFYYRFSKADHIKLIKFVYGIMLEPDYDRRLIHKACSLIKMLINDEIIKRNDLTLPWRPLYDLYSEVIYKRNSKNLDKVNIRSAVLAVKELFPLTATKEILDEIRPFIDIWNDYAMVKFVSLFSAFVPLKMSNEEHDLYGAGLWYDEMWISEYCPGYIDWSPKHTIIFSKLLRALNLSVRYNKVAVGDGTGMGSESSGAEWIIWMLGGDNESAHQCFERLIKCVETFLHPLHEGGHTPTLQSFLDALVSEMARRVRTERVRQKTKNKVPLRMRLTDEQIEWFVKILLPSVLYSVFSTTETSASSVIRNLAFLAPQLVLPKCLDLVYPSLSTITEPHRLQQSLECIVEICVPLVRDDGTCSYRTYNVCKRNWIADIIKTTEGKEKLFTLSSTAGDSETRSDTSRVPLREHAIFLLEALIEAVDINDFHKLSLSLQTLETIFHLIPIVDCSPALEMKKYMDLTDEEKHLCKLTSRFPSIVQNFISKVFKVITQLSIPIPSDCVSYIDSICDNSDIILTGNEEIVISTSIQSAFHALFSNCSSTLVELIGDQTYKFISTSEFENVVAADAACSLIQESTYANPVRYFPIYIKFLLEKQKQYLTEEKKTLKELDATTMWFAYLSQMIFSVPSELLLEFQKECIEMHKCTISMLCYNAYQGACWSLKNLLTQLTEIYPISEEDRQHELDLPLHLSLPIKKWGAKCVKDAATIKWHIPTNTEVNFAEKLLNEFAYSEILSLDAPQNMDKFTIKRSLFIIDSLLSCIGNRLPSFNTPEIKLSETAVDMDPIYMSSVSPHLKMFSFNGENIRERVRITMHNLMEFLLSQQDDQSKNLLLISSVLQTLCVNGSVPSFRARRKNTRINYSDPIQGRRAELYDDFERRVFSYQKVRIASQTTLSNLITKFPNSKCLLVDEVLEHLNPKLNIIHEEMKGALYILNKCGFLSSNTITTRCKCWLAIARLKNSASIRDVGWKLFVDGNANKVFYAKYQELSQPQAILASRNKFNERHERNQQRINDFRSELTEICKNKGQLCHWRQVDSARTFLFTFHRILFTTDVAEIFLQMLVDVRAKWRRIAAECIANLLKLLHCNLNRLVLQAADVKCKYACGLRVDNLCLAYDHAKLPKDEQTWNETIFVSKPHWGAYQWPRTLMIPAPANTQTELLRSASQFNDVEKLILEYMKNEQFLIFWHTVLLKEKEDSDVFYASEYRFVKSEHPVIRRAKTKLAATYCAGIIRGSKSWLFNDLQQMWSWLKPIIIYQIEGLMSETVYYWDTALKFCLDVTDIRRFHWLVETIFEIVSKPASTSWHRCVRLGLAQYVSSCSAWRTTQLLNRVIRIANDMIPHAWLAPERDQIANVLSFPAVYGFATGVGDDIPAAYKIPKLGEIMKIFDDHVQDTMKLWKVQIENRLLMTQFSQIPLSSSSKNSLCVRGRFRIEKVANLNTKRQLYIKTLLRFLNAYFLSCFTALSSPIISLFPLITHLADEETADNEQAEVVGDADLAVGASDILFQSWSGIYLCNELADEMLNSVEQTMNKSVSWKALVSIMKFLHVFIFSNIHVCEKQKRPEIVRRMVNSAICHTQLEVRREAADCLTALIRCDFQSITSCYIKELFECTNHKVLCKRHGAVLALSAVIRAFPFTIPPLVFNMIPEYCQLGTSTDSLTRSTVTETLRSFLRTHRDKMIEMGEKDQDRMSLRQDVDPKNIFSADRVEELLSFPIGPEESLQKTDHIYITDDNKRLLLIREYDDKRKSRSKNKLSSDDSLSRMDITPPLKSKEIISTSRSVRMDKRPYVRLPELL
uniref:Proteasome activator complex subunit 4 C-terminal domain-containing protein n=1 Tax=Setaria digitata TaxID=48799 RepID=A0A915PT72_9BILA